jgi:hypothetical protein
MSAADGRVVLVTIRVRRDPAFPSDDFISLRRYVVGEEAEPEARAEVTSVERALEVARRWLEEGHRDDAATLP